MEKQELLELFVAANQAAKSVKGDKFSPDVSRFKDVVRLLMQTPESLVCNDVICTNLVGKSLSFFRDHKNPNIRSEGNLLCNHFMKILYAQGRKPSCDKETSVKIPSTLMHKTGDSKRDKVREILRTALAKVANEVVETEMKKRVIACDPSIVAVSVESVMFKKLGCFVGSQKAKYRSILFNMNDSNNPDLRRKVLVGEIDGERLVTMKTREMASEKIQKEVQRINEKAKWKEENRMKMFQSRDMIMT